MSDLLRSDFNLNVVGFVEERKEKDLEVPHYLFKSLYPNETKPQTSQNRDIKTIKAGQGFDDQRTIQSIRAGGFDYGVLCYPDDEYKFYSHKQETENIYINGVKHYIATDKENQNILCLITDEEYNLNCERYSIKPLTRVFGSYKHQLIATNNSQIVCIPLGDDTLYPVCSHFSVIMIPDPLNKAKMWSLKHETDGIDIIEFHRGRPAHIRKCAINDRFCVKKLILTRKYILSETEDNVLILTDRSDDHTIWNVPTVLQQKYYIDDEYFYIWKPDKHLDVHDITSPKNPRKTYPNVKKVWYSDGVFFQQDNNGEYKLFRGLRELKNHPTEFKYVAAYKTHVFCSSGSRYAEFSDDNFEATDSDEEYSYEEEINEEETNEEEINEEETNEE